MFKALMRVQLASVMASLMRSSKGNEKRSGGSAALIAVLFVFVAAILVFAFGAMFYAIAEPMHTMALDWFYFAMAALTAFALCFIGSVFTAQQQLFSARDNELLLAMPIKPKFILSSRMVMLLAINYALELLVMLPAAVIWGVKVGYSAAGVAALVLGILLLPMLVLTFTCIIAWVLAAVSSRMRNKTIVTMVLYLAFLAAYFYVYMNFNNILTGLIANSAQLAGGVAVVYPVYAFGQAIAGGDLPVVLVGGTLLHLAGFAACCAVPFAIVCAILSRSFLSVTMHRPTAKKIVYREQKLAVSSASGALLKKELRHFGANGMYILNASLGSILTIAAAVALIIYRDTLITVLGALPEGWTAALMTIALCFLCATDVISAPSISLEGKTLWLLKSLPVTPRTILMSKVNLHLTIALPPTLIASVCCIIALPMSAADAAAVVIVPALMTFISLYGVVINLRFPKFDYINETAVIKNSMSVMITMFASWAVLAAPVILYVIALDGVLTVTVYMYICAALLAAACAAMYIYLGRSGAARFAAL